MPPRACSPSSNAGRRVFRAAEAAAPRQPPARRRRATARPKKRGPSSESPREPHRTDPFSFRTTPRSEASRPGRYRRLPSLTHTGIWPFVGSRVAVGATRSRPPPRRARQARSARPIRPPHCVPRSVGALGWRDAMARLSSRFAPRQATPRGCEPRSHMFSQPDRHRLPWRAPLGRHVGRGSGPRVPSAMASALPSAHPAPPVRQGHCFTRTVSYPQSTSRRSRQCTIPGAAIASWPTGNSRGERGRKPPGHSSTQSAARLQAPRDTRLKGGRPSSKR